MTINYTINKFPISNTLKYYFQSVALLIDNSSDPQYISIFRKKPFVFPILIVVTPKYRPDIDGLRAVAVLSVLFYHTGFEFFSGGYVGVDVFFVISGFLITTIIIREISAGTFSVANFYERRLRRILPAIIGIVIACLVVGLFLFEVKDYEDLARSTIANNLFMSNIFFYWQTGYFDSPGASKPLLHTWSLSLEEQYYVIMPLLLVLIAKYSGQKYLRFLVPIFFLSFIAGVVGMESNRNVVFYMLPTRAWELLIGSLLAIVALPKLKNAVAMNSIAGFGLSLIFYSVFAFDKQTAFPGAYAAIPALGTAFVIYAGASGTAQISRCLTFKPVVFIGLISYSLYLWHWPVIVIARYYNAIELTLSQKLLLLIVIVGFSVLSWRFIETPFRRKKLLATRKSIFVGSFAASLILIIVGLSILVVGGAPGRDKFEQIAEVFSSDVEWERWRSCEDVESRIAEQKGLCTIGTDGGTPSFLFWGDSQARALTSAVNASALRQGITGYVASQSACPPLQGIERPKRLKCHAFNEAVLGYLLQHSEIKTVILAARWVLSTEGTRYKNEEGSYVELVDLLGNTEKQKTRQELVEIGLRRTVSSIIKMGRRVVIVGSVPEVGHDVPSANHIALITNRDVNVMIAPSISEYESRNKKILTILSVLEKDFHLQILRPANILCDDDICRVALNEGVALYRDDDHLSTFGSKYVSKIFDPIFSQGK